MRKNITEYEGDIPPGVLEGKIGSEEFYTPEEIRLIILETFPQRSRAVLSGLEYISVGEFDFEDEEEFDRMKGLSDSREDLVRRAIPDWERVNGDTLVTIYESQVYRNKDPDNVCPYKKHLTALMLTDCGYLLEGHSIVESTMP